MPLPLTLNSPANCNLKSANVCPSLALTILLVLGSTYSWTTKSFKSAISLPNSS